MKKIVFVALIANLFFVTSCTKEKTTVVSKNGDTTITTIVSVDNEKIDSAKIKVNNGLEKTNDALTKGAKEVKEGLKKATSDAATAVEKGAQKVKEKTDK